MNMPIISIACSQTLIMLLLILCGILCSRLKIITPAGNKELSALVLNIVNPVMIFLAYQTPYNPEKLKNLGVSFALSFLSILSAVLMSNVFRRSKNTANVPIERFSSIYSNCGFMGIPLVNGLFGMEGVFYLTGFITCFNLFAWTHGVMLVSEQKKMSGILRGFRSPAVIAVFAGIICYAAELRLPALVTDAASSLASLNTPIAMIAAGVTISQTDLKETVKNLRIYVICLCRLLLFPLIAAGVICLFKADTVVALTVTAASACPAGAMGTLFAIKYEKNAIYAAEIFALSTILSVITIPLVMSVTTRLLQYL